MYQATEQLEPTAPIITMGTCDVVSWMNVYQNIIASFIEDDKHYLIILKSGHHLQGYEDKDTWNGDLDHLDWVRGGYWDITEAIPELDDDELDTVTQPGVRVYRGGFDECCLISHQKNY
jgi:hypothetical protein